MTLRTVEFLIVKRAAHGSFRLWTEDQILCADAEGPFNEEVILEFRNALEEHVARLVGSPWGWVSTLHGLSVFTPEAEQAILETVRWRVSKGMRCAANVLMSTEAGDLERVQISRVYDQIGIDYAFFENFEDAAVWVQQRLDQDSG